MLIELWCIDDDDTIQFAVMSCTSNVSEEMMQDVVTKNKRPKEKVIIRNNNLEGNAHFSKEGVTKVLLKDPVDCGLQEDNLTSTVFVNKDDDPFNPDFFKIDYYKCRFNVMVYPDEEISYILSYSFLSVKGYYKGFSARLTVD